MGYTRRNVVIVRGSRNPAILFVGEGPGKYEDMKSIPFCGPSGKLLDAEIGKAEIPAEICAFANMVKCRPLDSEGQNRAPTEEEVSHCLPFLKEQVDLMQPKLVVAVGKVAFIGLGKAGYKPMYVLHPAAALRNPRELMDVLQRHLADVKRTYDNLCPVG
jgi:uracil-DNA glycosylase family 4